MIKTVVQMNKQDKHCHQETRISSIENIVEVHEQRLGHYKNAVSDIQEDIEEVKEQGHQRELILTKAVDEMRVEVVKIHTTIKNVTLILSIFTGLVGIIVALPEIIAIIGV